MRLRFTKMQGAGNDFVVLDGTCTPIALTRTQLRHLGDRRFGVGADQILLVERPAAGDVDVDWRYRIFNGNGEEVEHCGNGARCLVRFLNDRGMAPEGRARVRTMNNRLELALDDRGEVRVDMGRPRLAPSDLPFDASGLEADPGPGGRWRLPVDGFSVVSIGIVSMGNPHAVIEVDDVDAAPVATLGPRIERHPRFARGVNVGFLQRIGPSSIALRVWERDAGETLACGTGACAAVVHGMRRSLLDAGTVQVRARGGLLRVGWDGGTGPVWLAGPAETVFEGEIELPDDTGTDIDTATAVHRIPNPPERPHPEQPPR